MNENNIPENINEESVDETVVSESEKDSSEVARTSEEEPASKKQRFRFTVLQTVLISAICIVLTFMLTAVAVINAMNAYFQGAFEILNGKLEEYENESENMMFGHIVSDEQRQRLFSLLLELDSAFVAYEFNEMDYMAITDYVLEAYAAAVGDKHAEYYTKEEFDSMMESMQGQMS